MEKFTWERFRTEKIAVWCSTKERAREFLNTCKSYGLRFASGAPIGKVTHWEANGRSTVYTLRCDQPYIEVRSTHWAYKHNYDVCVVYGVLVDLTVEERMCDTCGDDSNSYCSEAIADLLVSAGYRKQSEGEWRYDGKFKACSLCGTFVEWNTLGTSHWKYCPHCGAKMKSIQEDK